MIIRGVITVAFVWLMMPREPEFGSSSNNNTSTTSFAAPVLPCGAFQNGKCAEIGSGRALGPTGTLERLRGALLKRIDFVRADLKAHGSQIGAPFPPP